MVRLQDKVALVTGGGRGIGRGICLRLAKEGASVVVNDKDGELCERVAAEVVSEGGQAVSFVADITSSSEVRQMAQTVLTRFGRVDILVNNAGWTRAMPFVDTPESIWDPILGVCLKGPMVLTQALLPSMIDRRYGKIVNISSEAGRQGSVNNVVYSAAKHGIVGFTKALAKEVASYDINVNSVAPGLIDTPLAREQGEQVIKEIEGRILLGRSGKPEDIASAVAFLASDEANYITGQTLAVNGGLGVF